MTAPPPAPKLDGRALLIAAYVAFLWYLSSASCLRPFPATLSRWAALERRSLQQIRWVHGVNTVVGLELAFSGWRAVTPAQNLTMVIEADVMPATPSRPEVYMCHPPCRSGGGLSFADWLDKVLALQAATQASVGVKLDFKDPTAAETALQLMAKRKKADGTVGIPVWLNADVLQGPSGGLPRFTGQQFLDLCKTYYPKGALSLGWVTGIPWIFLWLNGYTSRMVDEMLAVADNAHTHEITFAVRGEFCPNSMPQLKRLIDRHPRHTLTVWGGGGMEEWLLAWVEASIVPLRISLDLDSTPLFWPQVAGYVVWGCLLTPLLAMLSRWGSSFRRPHKQSSSLHRDDT
eukprot:EG_transcript_15755